METAQQIFSIYVCAHEIVRDVIGSIFFGDELVQIIKKTRICMLMETNKIFISYFFNSFKYKLVELQSKIIWNYIFLFTPYEYTLYTKCKYG